MTLLVREANVSVSAMFFVCPSTKACTMSWVQLFLIKLKCLDGFYVASRHFQRYAMYYLNRSYNLLKKYPSLCNVSSRDISINRLETYLPPLLKLAGKDNTTILKVEENLKVSIMDSF